MIWSKKIYTKMKISIINFLIKKYPLLELAWRDPPKPHTFISPSPLTAGVFDFNILVSLNKYFTKTNIISGIISIALITLIRILGITESIFNYLLDGYFSEIYIKEVIELFFSGSFFLFIRLAIRGLVEDYFNSDLKITMGDGKDPSSEGQVFQRPISDTSPERLLAGPSSERPRSEIAQGKLPQSSSSNMAPNTDETNVLPENTPSNISPAVGSSNLPLTDSANISEVNNPEASNISGAGSSNLPNLSSDVNLELMTKHRKIITNREKLHWAIRKVDRDLEKVSNDVKLLSTSVLRKDELDIKKAEMNRLESEKLWLEARWDERKGKHVRGKEHKRERQVRGINRR